MPFGLGKLIQAMVIASSLKIAIVCGTLTIVGATGLARINDECPVSRSAPDSGESKRIKGTYNVVLDMRLVIILGRAIAYCLETTGEVPIGDDLGQLVNGLVITTEECLQSLVANVVPFVKSITNKSAELQLIIL